MKPLSIRARESIKPVSAMAVTIGIALRMDFLEPEWAGREGATSLELRAALNLSRLGSSPDALRRLGEVVGRFTEGDTANLRAAQTQLSVIHPPSND